MLLISETVALALKEQRPVVALESTIITHGMPFPHNLDMAKGVEEVVRQNGAVPATIALLDGHLCVGLSAGQMDYLAKTGHEAAKASRRDLSALLISKKPAGTTVATTMQIAAMAGISVFATGGIGGVHRGAEETFDISADLIEFSKTPVAVVCAGAKSILDIGKTLEVLETQGVPVVGYQTDEFPAFFVRESGHKVDYRFDTPADIAAMIRTQKALNMGGILIANPIPHADALSRADIDSRIDQAIQDAQALGIARKDVTPYLLGRIVELTDGKSLKANIALVRNNAMLAAQIAVALAQ